ncbi:PucR family transcriptional regulator [Nocardioides ultimimeridianus]
MSVATRLAAEIAEDGSAWVEHIRRRVQDELPDLMRSPIALELASASTASLLTQFSEVLAAEDMVGTEPPPDALEFARFLARAGVPLSSLLRSYRLGQEEIFGRAAQLAADGDEDGDEGGDVGGLREVGLLTFRFVDRVTTGVTDGYEAEREAFARGSALRRERTVARLMAGEPVALAEAERTLGWRLAGDHCALIAWPLDNDVDSAVVHSVTRRIADWAGRGRPLLLPGPGAEWSAWLRPAAGTEEIPQDLLAAISAARVRVAVGGVGSGVDGFVGSRREAEAARHVSPRITRPLVRYAEIALLHVLLSDEAAAARFVRSELGGLAAPEHAELRRTLRVYLEAGQDTTRAARVLDIHRNTVIRRIRRSEAVLGRGADVRPAETMAALQIAAAGTVLP